MSASRPPTVPYNDGISVVPPVADSKKSIIDHRQQKNTGLSRTPQRDSGRHRAETAKYYDIAHEVFPGRRQKKEKSDERKLLTDHEQKPNRSPARGAGKTNPNSTVTENEKKKQPDKENKENTQANKSSEEQLRAVEEGIISTEPQRGSDEASPSKKQEGTEATKPVEKNESSESDKKPSILTKFSIRKKERKKDLATGDASAAITEVLREAENGTGSASRSPTKKQTGDNDEKDAKNNEEPRNAQSVAAKKLRERRKKSKHQVDPSVKALKLAKDGDWITLDDMLKNSTKKELDVSFYDEVWCGTLAEFYILNNVDRC